MRLTVVVGNRRPTGGLNTYLMALLPALAERGYELALWHEADEGQPSARLRLPDATEAWCVEELGEARALHALAAWRPDLIFAHGLRQPTLEARVLEVAPAVLFVHTYYGTCVSGAKCFSVPNPIPCSRRFGLACLLHYYPRRCGGLNPATMWRQYRIQDARRRLLPAYRAIVANSDHMRQEIVRHGVAPERVVSCPLFAAEESANRATAGPAADGWRLLFLGRMDLTKGAQVLLDALPRIVAGLDRPVRLTLAGDGPWHGPLEARAARLARQDSRFRVELTGWLSPDERSRLIGQSHLIVVPSLWPEPFGMVGLEAGVAGLPAAAFDVGGISEWLADGVNGHLAPSPPTAAGLAAAVIACLQSDAAYRRLSAGARAQARRFGLQAHLDRLLPVLESAARQGGPAGTGLRPGASRAGPTA